MKFRKIFDEADDARAREHTDLKCLDDSLAIQGPSEDADINVLVRRFGIAGGPMPVAPVDPSAYGDLTDIPDLGTALLIMRDARERFDALPALLRRRFGNDPAELWDFVNDPQNGAEAVSLGLLQAPPEPPAPPAPFMPPAPLAPPEVPPKGAERP